METGKRGEKENVKDDQRLSRMKNSGMVLMIFLRKGCESCIHTSSYLTLLPSAFLPPFFSHSSVFKPVYTHPPLLVKLCAGTVGYLKMSARLWQV